MLIESVALKLLLKIESTFASTSGLLIATNLPFSTTTTVLKKMLTLVNNLFHTTTIPQTVTTVFLLLSSNLHISWSDCVPYWVFRLKP